MLAQCQHITQSSAELRNLNPNPDLTNTLVTTAWETFGTIPFFLHFLF